MADNYKYLTEAEKAYWDVYTRLRSLSDWEGFSDQQETTKQQARDWLVAQRKEIWRAAQPKPDGDGKGWSVNNRSQRYDQLQDTSLNTGDCHRVTQLPTNGGTPTEKTYISEREMWWLVSSVDDQTKNWRNANSSWLTQTRKQIYTLASQTTWDRLQRKLRFSNLCIATKTGKAYDNWTKTHDPNTGKETTQPGPAKPADTSSRQKAVELARSHLGVHETPHGSNKGQPQPSKWQHRVIGGDGYAWCACFATCVAWDAGVVGGSSAGVVVIMNMAQKGQGMFRGWTTDPSKVLRGDFAIVGCPSCHIGVVVDSNNPCHLIEGNGNDGGSYNGGEVVEKTRPRNQIVGWALVDYP
jgi:hypothetical protein